ncbi:nucleotidyltransferase domain-containing protein [Paenarthrobacter nitroguajacolicus]|uniref:nucleotidyltransferase domain-containing protein n=1 Tax=Paenarthrobacter nitroguajacolicus TaxID=211146 RepID=UPI003D1931F5
MLTVVATQTLEYSLNAARVRIQVSAEELEEARQRRNAIAVALGAEFAGSRIYVNGSIAHGDALTPLTDVDLGVVVPDPDNKYGPGLKGPDDLKQRAANAIRSGLKDKYGDLAVEVEGRKRSILIRFRDPVAKGLPDFTADVIVAVDNPDSLGLYIPRHDTWDRSHPELHTELIRDANESSGIAYARVVRLVKHWNRTHDKPLCSWNIKALALTSVAEPTTMIAGIRAWLEHAVDQLSKGETPDPARVALHPIRTNKPRTEVVRSLRKALESIDLAVSLERDGYPTLALDELAKLFKDEEMLPRPNQRLVLEEEARRVAANKAEDSKAYGAPALVTGTGAATNRSRINVRSWRP